MRIPIVENPRRQLSAKQKKAGFGGKRAMGKTRKRKPGPKRKRKNPAIMTLGNPSKRRRTTTTVTTSKRRYTRRSNPGFGNLLSMDTLKMAAAVAGGVLTAKSAPGLIRKVWPTAPTTGFMGAGLRVGAAVAVGMGLRMVTRSNKLAVSVVAGALGYEIYNMTKDFFPGLGDAYVTDAEIAELSGYVDTGSGVAGYVKEAAPDLGRFPTQSYPDGMLFSS